MNWFDCCCAAKVIAISSNTHSGSGKISNGLTNHNLRLTLGACLACNALLTPEGQVLHSSHRHNDRMEGQSALGWFACKPRRLEACKTRKYEGTTPTHKNVSCYFSSCRDIAVGWLCLLLRTPGKCQFLNCNGACHHSPRGKDPELRRLGKIQATVQTCRNKTVIICGQTAILCGQTAVFSEPHTFIALAGSLHTPPTCPPPRVRARAACAARTHVRVRAHQEWLGEEWPHLQAMQGMQAMRDIQGLS